MTKSVILEQLNSGFIDDAVAHELRDCIGALSETPFKMPSEMDAESFLDGISYAFLPHQVAPAETLTVLTPDSRRYLSREVQPSLQHGAEVGVPEVRRIAWHVGRVIGALNSSRLMTGAGQVPVVHIGENLFGGPSEGSPVVVNENSLEADHSEVDFQVRNGQVIEFGLGMNGLYSHLNAIRGGRYRVLGIHHTAGEVALLEGVRDYNEVSPDDMQLVSSGIERSVDALALDERELTYGEQWNRADLLVASRVHMAGEELMYGISRSSEVLRDDGLLVARGPSKAQVNKKTSSEGVGYNEVLDTVEQDPEMEILVNSSFVLIDSQDKVESNRLIVAKNRGAIIEPPSRPRRFGFLRRR